MFNRRHTTVWHVFFLSFLWINYTQSSFSDFNDRWILYTCWACQGSSGNWWLCCCCYICKRWWPFLACTGTIHFQTSLHAHKFKVVQFITKCSNNSEFKGGQDLAALACKSDFGKRFVENVKLGEDGNEAAIIVDFSQHGFIEDLTTGAESNFEVHYLIGHLIYIQPVY